MKNIINIFLGDLKKIQNNVIAWIVIMGLTIVPSLYAWFNIAASWDPYGNTGNLKVAVANTDQGYTGDLVPLELNLGDSVVSSLRENSQLGWVFTDKDSAIEGVKDGSYYAAIVLPESFSTDMMSLFSKEVQHSDILYYLNEKENAIAPKVTDKGASAIQKQIDEVFTQTMTQIGLDVMNGLSSVANKEDTEELIGNFIGNLQEIETELSTVTGTLKAFANMTDSLQQMLNTTSAFLQQAKSGTDAGKQLLNETGKGASTLADALNGTTAGINDMLLKTSNCYTEVSAALDQAFTSLSADTGAISGTLTTLAGQTDSIIRNFTNFRNALESFDASLPDESVLARRTLNKLIGRMDDSISQQEHLRDKLNEAAGNMNNAISGADSYRTELKTLAQQSASDITAIQTDYETNIQQKMSNLSDTLKNTNNSITGLLENLDTATQDISTLSSSTSSDLGGLKEILDSSVILLENSDTHLKEVITELKEAAQSGNLETLKNILGSDPDAVSSFMAAPVALNTTKLYPVENYGSAMAPFYSSLSIWVGGIVLVAMLKVTLSEERKAQLSNLKNHQIYLGRYLLFLIMGLMQSGLICLGDLFYLEIQCEHPFYFLLAGWITSIVFVNIIYTLTVSFGDIGKAICVVLLVMQVAGSGGTFPIEMTPSFFQKAYPLLPFTHSMNAMRECIAGFYGYTYVKELGILMVFLLLSLLLGLVLRKPVIRLNELFAERLESTKLM